MSASRAAFRLRQLSLLIILLLPARKEERLTTVTAYYLFLLSFVLPGSFGLDLEHLGGYQVDLAANFLRYTVNRRLLVLLLTKRKTLLDDFHVVLKILCKTHFFCLLFYFFVFIAWSVGVRGYI